MTYARRRRPRAGARALAALLLLLAGARSPAAAQSAPPDHAMMPGEELVYNVRYGFFDLGQVRIRTMGVEHEGGAEVVHCKALIDSYKGVPFVDLHAIFESLIDTAVYSRRFDSRQKEDGSWSFAAYRFEYPAHRVLIDVGTKDSVVSKRDTLTVDTHYHDGLSLFFYARAQLFSGLKVNVPTVIKEQKVNTSIDFRNEHTSVDLDAAGYPVDVVRFEGNMEFVGIFGLTGGFEGWFSNDDARVPIQAKMKVLIGSVTVELMKWTRPGWSPPRAKG